MTSVNTNSSATTALRTLQQTNKALDTTQNKISTGLKIGEAKDNAAYWAISTTLKSDNKSLSTVKDALGLGAATVDVAYQGLNKSKEVLEEIQKKLTAATQDGVDRTIIQSEINELKKQLVAIAGASSFSGENWLSVDSSAAGYNGTKQLVSSFSRSSSNAVSIGTIGVETAAIKLFDASASADGVLDTKVALKKADGTSLSYGGFAAVAGPSVAALNFSGTATGSGGTSVAGAKASLGTLNLAGVTAGDNITFSLSVDGTSNTVRLATTGLTAGNFVTNLQAAVNAAVGSGKATVVNTAGAITLEAVSTGTSSQITVGPVSTVDGNGVVTDTAGILTGGSLPAPKFGGSFEASAAMGTFAAAPTGTAGSGAVAAGTLGTVNADAGSAGTLTFNVTFNGVTRSVTTGSITNDASATTQADNMATAMQTAINTAFAGTRSTQNGRLYVANDIVVDNTAGAITIGSAKEGFKESVQISGLTGTGGFAPSAGAITGIPVAGATATGTGQGAGIVSGDTYSLTVQYGSTVKQITHTFVDADFAASGIASTWATAGEPTAAEWETFLQTKVDTAFAGTTFNGVVGGAAYAAGDVDIKQAAGVFSVETRKKGADMSVGISAVSGSIYGVTTAGSRLGIAADSTSNYYNASNVKTAGTGVVGYGKATVPVLEIGVFDNTNVLANDRVSMTVNVNGTEKTISVSTDGILGGGGNLAADTTTFQTKVQNALDGAFGANVVTFTGIDAASTGANKMTLKAVAAGSTSYIAISNVTTADGNGSSSATAGLTAGVSNAGVTANGTNVAVASTATLVSGTSFAGPQTINANDTISFNVAVDGVSKSVNVDRARVDAALGAGANGVITNGTDYAAVLNSAFTAAGVAVTVTAPSNVLTFTRNGGPAAGTVAVTGVTSSGGSSTMSVDNIDLTANAFTSLNATQKKEVLASYISVVNTAIKSVTTAASELGSVSSRIELQQSFVDTLMDTIDKGVGNLVDADLSEESTRLQALQTKQQLGVQALSIANQSTQNILRLFQ